MLRLVIIATVAIVMLADVQAHDKAKCPFTLGKYPFDVSKFAGEWNLIAATPFKGEKVGNCGRTHISMQKHEDEKTVSGRYTANSAQDSKPLAFEVIMQCLIPKTGLSLSVYRKEGTEKWSDVYKTSIIATDYISYALSVSCKEEFDMKTTEFSRHAVAEIWSRNETLSQDTLDTLVNVASGYDINPSTIQKVDRSNCK